MNALCITKDNTEVEDMYKSLVSIKQPERRDRQVKLEKNLAMLKTCLKEDEKGNAFFELFSSAILDSDKLSEKNKKKNWSIWYTIALAFIVLVAVVTAIGYGVWSIGTEIEELFKEHVVDAQMINALQEYINALSIKPIYIYGGIGGVLLLLTIGVHSVRRDYEETWVRHTTNLARLNFIMVEYIANGDYSEEAQRQFRKKALDQLEKNISTFETNMQRRRIWLGKKS